MQTSGSSNTVVFPKEGQLAERYAIRHGLCLRQIGRRYELRRQKLFWSFAVQGQRYALRCVKLCWSFAVQGQRYALQCVKLCWSFAVQGQRYALRCVKLFRSFAAPRQYYASRHKVAATFFGVTRLE
jgi:hypothetical protein